MWCFSSPSCNVKYWNKISVPHEDNGALSGTFQRTDWFGNFRKLLGKISIVVQVLIKVVNWVHKNNSNYNVDIFSKTELINSFIDVHHK